MRMPDGFDKANKERRKKTKPVRHIILWAKNWYENKTLEQVIAKITAIQPKHVTLENKFYWLKKACKKYDIKGYEIVDRFFKKSNGFIDYRSPEEQMICAMRTELMEVKINVVKEVQLYDLGKPDLFKEE